MTCANTCVPTLVVPQRRVAHMCTDIIDVSVVSVTFVPTLVWPSL